MSDARRSRPYLAASASLALLAVCVPYAMVRESPAAVVGVLGAMVALALALHAVGRANPGM